jgi:hypothetical protein
MNSASDKFKTIFEKITSPSVFYVNTVKIYSVMTESVGNEEKY